MRVDVDLVTIEVYALDGKGNPVRNLKKEDFRLYENGKKQEILSFDEVDGNSDIPASALPILDGGDMPHGKTVLIIFDEGSIPESQVRKIQDSAGRFVREHMQPRDLFAVASWGGAMRIIQNLTDDRDAVLAAIARAVAGRGWGVFEAMLQSLEQINYSIASTKGQKAVLIFGRPSTIYGLSLSDTYYKTLTSAKKSNVVYYMVDPGSKIAIGLEPPDLTIAVGDSETRKILPPPEYTMKSLAAASGGFSIADVNAIDTKLDKLNQQISSYYILGFQSGNQRHDGAYRKVKVSTRLKDLTLKYQPGYQDRRPVDVLASSKQEQMLLTALATPGTATRLPVSFRPACFYDVSRPARVLIAAKIRTAKMTFLKKGAQIGFDLNIMGAAYAENGSIAARFSQTLPIRFDKEKESEFRKQDLAYRNYFRLRPGKYRLRLAAADESNNLGSMEQSLEVPPLPGQGLAFSSLVVSEQLSALPYLIPELRTQLLDHSDPLLYRGVQIQPSVENRLPINSAISVLFRAYNLPGRPEEWDLVASPRLLGEKGDPLVLTPIHLKDVMSPSGPAQAVIGLRLPFQNIPPGKYRLMIEVKENVSAQTATLQTDLEFF
jgi:VWFA-related protein